MLINIFLTFFKIGLFTFGGGYAMIAQIRETLVQNKEWITEDELLEIVAIAESTPGPIAINMATYVGYKRKGALGSVAATLGVVLPSVIIIYLISLFLDEFMKNKYVSYAFTGIKCAVAFLIAKAGFEMFNKIGKKLLPILTFCIMFVGSIILELLQKSISSIIFIIIGGILGIVLYGILNIEGKCTNNDCGKISSAKGNNEAESVKKMQEDTK